MTETEQYIEELENKYAQLIIQATTLYDAIAHGDEEHRRWLKEAIDKHFGWEKPNAKDPSKPKY